MVKKGVSKEFEEFVYDIENYEISMTDKKITSISKDIKKIFSSLNEIIENKHIRYQQLLENLALELNYDRAYILSFNNNFNSFQENYEFTRENIKSNAEQIKNLNLNKFNPLIDILKENKFVFIPDISKLNKNIKNYNYFIKAAAQFFVKSVLLFPIFDKNDKLSGIIGLSNQNNVNRMEKPDIIYLSYLLSIIKNFVGLNILEDKYEAVFNSADIAIILLNQKGLIIEGNKKIEEISGYKIEEVVNKKYFQEFIKKNELNRVESYFKHRGKKEGIPNNYTTKIRSKDKGIKDVSINVSMLKGKKLRIVAISDITERINKEKKLKEMNKRYVSLFNKNSSVMLLINPKSGQIEDANQAAVNFYGYSYDKLISMKFQEINTLTEEVKKEMKKADTENKNYFNLKHRLSNGEIKDVEIYSSPIVINGQRIVYSIIHDISEKTEIKERWLAEKQFNKALINTAPAIIRTLNKNMKLTSINDYFEELTGYKKEKIINNDFIDIITAPEDKAEIYNLFTDIFNGNKNNVYNENAIITKSGERKWLAWNNTLLKNEYYGEQILSIGVDITERKKKEEKLNLQLELERSISKIEKLLEKEEIDYNKIMREVMLKINLDRIGITEFPIKENNYKSDFHELVLDKSKSLKAKYKNATQDDFKWWEITLKNNNIIEKHNFVQNSYRKELTEFIEENNIKSFIAVPLIYSDKLYGVVNFNLFKDNQSDWNTREIKYMKSICKNIKRILTKKMNLLAIKNTLNSTVETLSSIVEMKDAYTYSHQKGVSDLAVEIAKKMGLKAEKIESIRIAALLHDIGKIKIPGEILSNPSKISDLEYNLIKKHSEHGYNILKKIDFKRPIADIVLQHHEKMDGSGYPNALKEEEILLESKIISVADVVEAMSSRRPYREALGIEEALKEIKGNKGTKFNSEVVKACVELFENNEYEL